MFEMNKLLAQHLVLSALAPTDRMSAIFLPSARLGRNKILSRTSPRQSIIADLRPLGAKSDRTGATEHGKLDRMSVRGGVARLELRRSAEGCAGWSGALPQHGRRAVGEHITFVGLDVHKATTAVCLAEAGRDGEVRFAGEIPNGPAALDKLAARLSRGGRTLRFAHEVRRAGPPRHRLCPYRGPSAPRQAPRHRGGQRPDDPVTAARRRRCGRVPGRMGTLARPAPLWSSGWSAGPRPPRARSRARGGGACVHRRLPRSLGRIRSFRRRV
jgi:hypothetical protein